MLPIFAVTVVFEVAKEKKKFYLVAMPMCRLFINAAEAQTCRSWFLLQQQ